MKEITMQQKLLQHCIIISCIINHASEILSSTSPRGRKPGTNKYKDIVCSGRIWLQHKASCYRGHGYSNRLSSLQRCTGVILHARISRVAYTLLGNTPPRLSDTPQSILQTQQRGHPPV